jgi:hypothetical protein
VWPSTRGSYGNRGPGRLVSDGNAPGGFDPSCSIGGQASAITSKPPRIMRVTSKGISMLFRRSSSSAFFMPASRARRTFVHCSRVLQHEGPLAPVERSFYPLGGNVASRALDLCARAEHLPLRGGREIPRKLFVDRHTPQLGSIRLPFEGKRAALHDERSCCDTGHRFSPIRGCFCVGKRPGGSVPKRHWLRVVRVHALLQVPSITRRRVYPGHSWRRHRRVGVQLLRCLAPVR